MLENKHVVGIFSRDAQDAFDWLIRFLLTIPGVKDVRPVYISNTNYINIMDEAYKCSFAILYHSKNRGRINVTNVTDALYDRELADLSNHLGRDGVIVVIDDLEDTSLEVKNKILQQQPSIERLAMDLFLFGDQDKNYQGEASDSFTGNKQLHMKRLISGKMKKGRRSETSVNIDNDDYQADARNCLQRINKKCALICISLIGLGIIVIILAVELSRPPP